MIKKKPVLNAEKKLFNSALCKIIEHNPENEIKKIIGVYVQDEEIKALMQQYKLTQEDFEKCYTLLFDEYDYRELIFLDDEPCLFITALLLSLDNIITFGHWTVFGREIRGNAARMHHMEKDIRLIADSFFRKNALQQKIVSIEYYRRDGVADKLKK